MIPWTIAWQAPLSMGFSRQEYWNGLLFLLQGIISNQGLNLQLLHWQAGALPLSYLGCNGCKRQEITQDEEGRKTILKGDRRECGSEHMWGKQSSLRWGTIPALQLQTEVAKEHLVASNNNRSYPGDSLLVPIFFQVLYLFYQKSQKIDVALITASKQ